MRTKVTINNTELQVAPINFGGNVFGWTLDEQQSFAILDAFTAAGFNFIDTADTYSWWVNGTGGQSETIIGTWLNTRKNRDQVVIATKVGSHTAEHPYDLSRSHILKSVDASLKRLQTDYIDLYYTHFDDEKTPIEETLAAYDQIIKAGKVRYIAASNVSPPRIQKSMELAEKNNLPRYVALQPYYNLINRKTFEQDYAPLVEQYNFSVFTYFSLESGFLTGKYRTEADFGKTTRGEGIKKYFDARGKAILTALDKVAAKHSTTPTTVSLAWLLAKPLVTAPIVSARTTEQLTSLIKAPELKLDMEDMELLDNVSNLEEAGV
ncbi:aldo/keto reductase [Desulfobulbus rhabdoformis]|uniref:aldo/keto reductase n=1 Tax=Desulfobulbus rhabdoformis TaxID=34032 RepID=UPI0019653D19|nr:aldo/keto reductase [Desulfobulbus rhabdoformis]MBM9614672.1 aldo/keto reductase [Desulfobulbus rhabdoformis]